MSSSVSSATPSDTAATTPARPAVLLVPSWALWEAITQRANYTISLTIEAEYGQKVAEGTVYTAAHHQPAGSPYAGNHIVEGGRPSPCNDTAIPILGEGDTVVLSHIDLDAVGGALRAFAEFADLFANEHSGFWKAAAAIDVRGPHMAAHLGIEGDDLAAIQAWWAWSRKEIPRFDQGDTHPIRSRIVLAGEALRAIFAGDKGLLAQGAAFVAQEAALNEESFVREADGVILRCLAGPGFVNHLYTTPEGVLCKAVVAYNQAAGTVTVSRTEQFPELNCREVVQTLWGPEAGGHPGIAGSPRGQAMTLEQAQAAWSAVIQRALD